MKKKIKVIVKCIYCGSKKEVRANEVPKGEMPMCECGGVMLTEKAEIK